MSVWMYSQPAVYWIHLILWSVEGVYHCCILVLLLILLLIFDSLSFYSPDWPWPHFLIYDDLKVKVILVPQPCECLNYSFKPSYLNFYFFFFTWQIDFYSGRILFCSFSVSIFLMNFSSIFLSLSFNWAAIPPILLTFSLRPKWIPVLQPSLMVCVVAYPS